MASVEGYSQLQARLHAITSPRLMNRLGLEVVREGKLLVHRKTGNTGRTIHISATTATSVTISAGGAAVYLERGTRAHVITPKAAMALRWAASSGGSRLTGSPRVGAAVIFAKVVHHPGTKPYPFLMPAARSVVAKFGLGPIVDQWNSAA